MFVAPLGSVWDRNGSNGRKSDVPAIVRPRHNADAQAAIIRRSPDWPYRRLSKRLTVSEQFSAPIRLYIRARPLTEMCATYVALTDEYRPKCKYRPSAPASLATVVMI